MPVIKGTVEYEGTNYSGWQRQTNSNSIQDEIERALRIILKDEIKIVGSGRTDAGVHALNQVFHFKISENIDLINLKKSLNSLLPEDIAIKDLSIVYNNFHARYSATRRTYLYVISRRKNVFWDRFSWTIFSEINFNALKEIQSMVLGKKDFSSFCKAEEEVQNKICNVSYSRWFNKDDFLLYFISADRFIHGMVRGIVGLMIEYAKSKLNLEEIKNILDGKARNKIWAPSKGLILYNVEYKE
ncbi:MAG: tRNA pseudouridine(38-40) synthase TruA [Ignavibacteria bacterium]